MNRVWLSTVYDSKFTLFSWAVEDNFFHPPAKGETSLKSFSKFRTIFSKFRSFCMKEFGSALHVAAARMSRNYSSAQAEHIGKSLSQFILIFSLTSSALIYKLVWWISLWTNKGITNLKKPYYEWPNKNWNGFERRRNRILTPCSDGLKVSEVVP